MFALAFTLAVQSPIARISSFGTEAFNQTEVHLEMQVESYANANDQLQT